MRRSMFIVSVAGMLAAGGAAHAATPNKKSSLSSQAQAGLAAMKGLNVVVMNDWNAGNEVEGKVWVGGNVNQYNGQAKTQVGFGNANQYSGQSNFATMTVLGNLNSGIDLYNGATKNGTVGTYGGSATGSYGATIGGNQAEGSNGLGTKAANAKIRIGGNAAGLKLDYAGADVVVDGQLNGNNTNFNGSGMSVRAASYIGNTNGLNGGTTVKISGANPNAGSTPPTGWSFNQTQTLDAPKTADLSGDKSAMLTNLSNLSTMLAGVQNSSTYTKVSAGGGSTVYDLLFSTSATTGDYNVFSISATDLFAARNLGFQLNGSTKQVIINVTGIGSGSYAWGMNGGVNGQTVTWDSTLNSQLLWNLSDATASSTVTFNTDLHGALLDPFGSVVSIGVLEGTVVAGTLSNKGEVHLGTFDGASPDAVPEPATWAMLVLGFGVIGGAMRRGRRIGGATIAS